MTHGTGTGQALDDVVVLDLTHHIAGPYATKLMADFGADVIKIERPGGDIARRFGPFQGDEPHPEKSGLFFFLNTNKRSVVLDLHSDAGRGALRQLAARADLVVENFRPGVAEALGIGWADVHALNPKASMISVSNFGQDGPYRDYRLTDLVLYGFAGEMYSMGATEREPVKMAGTAALFESGAAISAALMGALWSNRANGEGQHVDIALTETHFGGVDRRHATAIASQFSGRKTLRLAGAGSGMPQGIYPCADGYVDFTNAGLRPDRILDMVGFPEWATDEKYFIPENRLNPEYIDEWNANFLVWCLERTKREIWEEARRAKVMCGPLFTVEDMYEDEHFRERGFWTKVTHPAMGEVELPGRPLMMAEGGWQLRQPAPLLGQHTEEVLREAGLSDAEIAAVVAANKEAQP
ncbi:MAG: CoA transferase [Dehalococcoidia bacterium]|nr:CoA transferase [Dehalococcoidia bacterium]